MTLYTIKNDFDCTFYGIYSDRQDAEKKAQELEEYAKRMNWQHTQYEVVEYNGDSDMTKTEKKGKYIYTFDGRVFRNSKRDYKYVLFFKTVKAKGALEDGVYYPIALGNNPSTMVSSWKSIFHHGDLKVKEIINQ